MKKIITAVLIVAGLLLLFSRVRFCDTVAPDFDMLESRLGTLVVHRSEGVVLDAEGHGRTLGIDDYISYRHMPNLPAPGGRVVTYVVFNPFNNYVDDIILRLDFPQ